MSAQKSSRTGLLYGFAAYGMWGLLPLYWHALDDTGAGEVLAHRMVWSLPTALVILALVRRWSWVPALLRQPKKLGLVVLASLVISVNWGLFIWAISDGRVLESSLGYFINPLVSIAFGVVLLRERLRLAQWVAVGIGALAVVVMTVAYGQAAVAVAVPGAQLRDVRPDQEAHQAGRGGGLQRQDRRAVPARARLPRLPRRAWGVDGSSPTVWATPCCCSSAAWRRRCR